MRKIQVLIGNEKVMVDDSTLSKKEDGSFYAKYNQDGIGDVEFENELLIKSLTLKIKSAIIKAVATIRVEVEGVGYDGNEIATTRMDKAIATLIGDEVISWKTYDNSTVVITQRELSKVLRKSGIILSKLWFCESIEQIEDIVLTDSEWFKRYSK
tara:strand:- start:2273 stop:2737 length:465 start_codon:yes stop_codon:yes gene_type:complete